MNRILPNYEALSARAAAVNGELQAIEREVNKNFFRTDDEPTPRCCPKCGFTALKYGFPQWTATSNEDPLNVGILYEFQCANEDCCISFWL
jgi:hypothetical protein